MSKLVRPEAFINWFVWGMLQHASFNGENIIDIDHQRNSKSLEFNPARTFSEAQTFCRPALLLSIVCVHLPQCPLVLRAKIGCCLLTGIRLCTCSDNSSCFDYWYIDILIYLYIDILIYWYIDILIYWYTDILILIIDDTVVDSWYWYPLTPQPSNIMTFFVIISTSGNHHQGCDSSMQTQSQASSPPAPA